VIDCACGDIEADDDRQAFPVCQSTFTFIGARQSRFYRRRERVPIPGNRQTRRRDSLVS